MLHMACFFLPFLWYRKFGEFSLKLAKLTNFPLEKKIQKSINLLFLSKNDKKIVEKKSPMANLLNLYFQ
jgi:hypothetical protein